MAVSDDALVLSGSREGELTASEAFLLRARRRATRLAVALVRAPFSVETVTELTAYVEQDAEAARVAYQQLRDLPESALRRRITELTAGRGCPAGDGPEVQS
ncbi:hypothetical protein ABZY02_35355 [Streptomyces sp. NPDC006649]|uniref:hypothetical protein n=1 Tax=Streptomyces sp. NPDC006649 TaxID=3156896 RepID=UPI0033A12108